MNTKIYMNCETNKNNISSIVYSCKQMVYVNDIFNNLFHIKLHSYVMLGYWKKMG
jgi:hypothetical protein